MNVNKENDNPECICEGDSRVRVLLGKQKRPAAGGNIRKSRFVYSLYDGGQYLLFNTMTRQLLAMPPQCIDWFSYDRIFPASVLEQELPAKLYDDYFLVPADIPESRTYLELRDILVLKEELPAGIANYVILPTTTCNARCFYCFEQGMQYQKMKRETVEDTLRFMLDHKPKDKKRIHIHWFGGEPMCAADNIDRICTGLTEAGVEFTAEMTSNGSLFTEETAEKAAKEWKIGKIQITLDGMAEEYARRKRYTAAMKDPFETVIRNIHLLIASGIKVMVRLNADEDNLGEIYRVADFLKKEFDEEERKKLQVYAHSLFGQSGEGLDDCPVSKGSDKLEAFVLEINDYLQRQGLMMHDLGELFTLKPHYCMVMAPECNVLIDAAGELFACDAMPEDMHYGNVRTGIEPDAWDRIAAPCRVRSECDACAFLPVCTEFDRCPNRIPFDDCYRQEKRKLERELRFAHNVYREQFGVDTEKKEAAVVSD